MVGRRRQGLNDDHANAPRLGAPLECFSQPKNYGSLELYIVVSRLLYISDVAWNRGDQCSAGRLFYCCSSRVIFPDLALICLSSKK